MQSSPSTSHTRCGGATCSSVILWITDGGATWTQALDLSRGTPRRLMSVSCADSNTCTTVGDYPTGLIFRTTDGGTTWTEQSATGGARALWGVSCADASTCTAVGTSLIHTTDGGATWTQSNGEAFGVSCPNVNPYIAVQGIGTIPRADILRSTDGADTG